MFNCVLNTFSPGFFLYNLLMPYMEMNKLIIKITFCAKQMIFVLRQTNSLIIAWNVFFFWLLKETNLKMSRSHYCFVTIVNIFLDNCTADSLQEEILDTQKHQIFLIRQKRKYEKGELFTS